MIVEFLFFQSILAALSFEDIQSLLKQPLSFNDGSQCFINPEGPLSPYDGYFFINSGATYRKTKLSYAVKTLPRCKCRDARECCEKCEGTFECTESKPYLFNGYPHIISADRHKYIIDYHHCLLSMFKCKKDVVNISNSELTLYLHHLKSVVSGAPTASGTNASIDNKDMYFLAFLLLLTDGLNLFTVSEVIDMQPGPSNERAALLNDTSPGPGRIRKALSTDSQRVSGRGIECKKISIPFRDGERVVSDPSLRRIIDFFGNCGKEKGYKKIISEKMRACERSENDTTEILETPLFLLQSYIHSYFANTDREEYVEFIKCVFRLLKPESRVYTRGDDDKSFSEDANEDEAYKRKKEELFHKYFIKANSSLNGLYIRDVRSCDRYKSFVRAIEGNHRIFPFHLCLEPLKETVSMVDRIGASSSTASYFSNSNEFTILSILCFLLYDYETGQFRISHLPSIGAVDYCNDMSAYHSADNSYYSSADEYDADDEYNPYGKLIRFFTKYSRPELLCKDSTKTMRDFNRILLDFNQNILTYSKKELDGDIFSLLAALDYITGNLAALNSARRLSTQEVENELSRFAEKLHFSNWTSIRNLEFHATGAHPPCRTNAHSFCGAAVHSSRDAAMHSPQSIGGLPHVTFELSNVGMYGFLRIECLGKESKATYHDETSAQMYSDFHSFKSSLEKQKKTRLSDLLCKTLAYKLEPYFKRVPNQTANRATTNSASTNRAANSGRRIIASADELRSSKVQAELKELVKKAIKKRNPDHLLWFDTIIKRHGPVSPVTVYHEQMFFLNILRGYFKSKRFKKKLEFCNFAINAAFSIAQDLKRMEEKSFVFFVLHGINNWSMNEVFNCHYMKSRVAFVKNYYLEEMRKRNAPVDPGTVNFSDPAQRQQYWATMRTAIAQQRTARTVRNDFADDLLAEMYWYMLYDLDFAHCVLLGIYKTNLAASSAVMSTVHDAFLDTDSCCDCIDVGDCCDCVDIDCCDCVTDCSCCDCITDCSCGEVTWNILGCFCKGLGSCLGEMCTDCLNCSCDCDCDD